MIQFWQRWIYLWAFVSIFNAWGCNDPGCIRNSQCPSGTICSQGKCIVPPATDAHIPSDIPLYQDALPNDGASRDTQTDGNSGMDVLHDALSSDTTTNDIVKIDGAKSDSVKADSVPADAMKRDAENSD